MSFSVKELLVSWLDTLAGSDIRTDLNRTQCGLTESYIGIFLKLGRKSIYISLLIMGVPNT
jgi:hypothetical protein